MRPRILTALGFGLGLLAFSACDRNSADTTVETTENPGGGGGGTTTTPLTKPSFKSFAPAKDTTRAWEDSVLTVQMTSDVVSPNLFYINGKLLTEGTTSAANGSVSLAVGPNLIKLRVMRAGDSTKLFDTAVTITRLLPTPTFSVLDTISYAPVTVAISAPAGLGSIRFTTDGNDPRVTDSLYTAPLTFTGTTTIKARLFATSGAGGVATKRYAIYHQVQRPTFSTRTVDTFNVVTKVALHPASSTDTIRYTTDGGDPTSASSIYKDSIRVDLSTKIKARSFNGMNKPSSVESTTVVLQAIAPSFSLASGVYKVSRTLNLTTASKCNIYYTMDSTKPVSKWTLVTATSPIVIDTNAKVWAFAGNPGWTVSPTLSATYTFVTSTPTFSLKSGTYDTTQLVTLADSTANATVHYTLDGTTPTCASALYAAPLRLDSTTLVKVIGCREGWTSSTIDSALYVFKVAPIVFSPDSGVFDGSPTITLMTRSPGVSFFYTIDSSTPISTVTGTTTKAYTAPFVLSKKGWLRVVGVRQGWTNSDIANRYYFVQGDTLNVGDFETGTINTAWGVPFSPFGCATGATASTGQPGCTITKNPADLLTRVDAGSPSELGNYALRMKFDLHPASTVGLADERNSPGFAGVYALVPSSYMGRGNTVAFWARFKPEGSNTATTAPMMVEFSHSGLDNGNTGLSDGFERAIIQIDTAWRFYQLAFGNFWYPHFAINKIAPLTNDAPPAASWIDIASINAGNAGSMTNIGLNRWWGRTIHSNSSITSWLHGVNRDQSFSKGTISKFRWSILQPSANPDALTSDEDVTGLSNTFQGSLYLDRVQVYRPKI